MPRLTPEQRAWNRLLRELDSTPISEWEIVGLLGEPDLFPDSLYKLYLRRKGSKAKWWLAQSAVGQTPLDPVSHQNKLWAAGSGLERTRVLMGPATLLEGKVAHPGRPALVRLLSEVQARA